MDAAAIERAAVLLAQARQSRRSLAGLPRVCQPKSLEDAYLIQERLVAILGTRTVGWFCGASSREIQRMIGLQGPYCARVLAPSLHAGPALLAMAEHPVLAWECEFGFRLRHSLPPRLRPYDRVEVIEAIAAFHPVLEVVTSRYERWREQPPLCRLADNGGDGSIVCGEAVENWYEHDLATVTVELTVNGTTIRRGRGNEAMGDPLQAMTWLVNAVNARGATLHAGDFCSTGTVTGIHLGTHDDVATANFAGLGCAEARFLPGEASRSAPPGAQTAEVQQP